MSALSWDNTTEHLYETGIEKGVLYVQDTDGAYQEGVAWNGLISVNESPDGADANDLYADNIKYLSLRAAESFNATITAYQSPAEFDICDGSVEVIPGVRLGQQSRRQFGFCYTTRVGNDVEGTDYGYKIHIIYNATAAPSDREYQTVNDSPEAIELSWEINTTPIPVTVNGVEYKPTAAVTLDSKKLGEAKMTAIKNKLYGTASSEPTLLTPSEIYDLIKDIT